MDPKLQLIAHLYDEPSDDLQPLAELLEDDTLRAEYEDLQQVRFEMDHRIRVRPDAGLVDALLAGALRPGHTVRVDRAPVARIHRMRRLLVPVAAVAAMLVVAIAMYSWIPTPGPTVATRQAERALTPPESLMRALPPTATLSPRPASTAQWETGDDVRQLARRIDALRAAGVDQWDEPAVPLELLSPTAGQQQVVPAGNRR